ncbi:MAG: Zn-dependent exopeptidase M28 [FCB group bacterium]|nr:Zn-dependent exopeptidase M28 [FCB group bacterium]
MRATSRSRDDRKGFNHPRYSSGWFAPYRDKLFTVPTLLFIAFFSSCPAQNFRELPADFGLRAYRHVKQLCEFGTRSPGSLAESKTIQYLKDQFSGVNMTVKIDSFYYRWIQLENRQIAVNGSNLMLRTGFVNQRFQDTVRITGKCLILKPVMTEPEDLKDRIIFARESNQVIRLKKYSPAAIIILDESEYQKVSPLNNQIIELRIPASESGNPHKSYNIIASYPESDNNRKDIILTAHWDSNNGPGADDNASGTAALIELARYFQPYADTLPFNLIFVATGAEEAGMMGSKAYLLQYSDDLNHCVLNINIDGVGSGKKIYIEMKNPQNFREDDTGSDLELISTDNFQTGLYTSFLEIYRNSSAPEIYPPWLTKNITSTMKALHYRYSKASCCSGADHRSFAYLSIPVVFIDIISRAEKKTHHSARDLPTENFIDNLNKTGKIVKGIIIRTSSATGL